MPAITITKDYQDGDILTEADLDAIRSDIIEFLNTTKLDSDNIQDAGIQTSKIQDSAITTAKINDASVTTAKMADASVTTAKLAVAVGNFVGEIKSYHSFNGTVSTPRGWMLVNGDVVNEASYNALHGAGAYAEDGVADSPILDKHLPNLVGHYEVGVAETTQDGTAAITTVGNTDHVSDLSHSHTVNSHNHKWHGYGGSDDSYYYNASGTVVSFETTAASVNASDHQLALNFGASNTQSSVGADAYTTNSSPGTSTELATSNIQPESIEVIKIMKVI